MKTYGNSVIDNIDSYATYGRYTKLLEGTCSGFRNWVKSVCVQAVNEERRKAKQCQESASPNPDGIGGGSGGASVDTGERLITGPSTPDFVGSDGGARVVLFALETEARRAMEYLKSLPTDHPEAARIAADLGLSLQFLEMRLKR